MIRTRRPKPENNNNATSEFFEQFDERFPKSINERHQNYLEMAAKIALNSNMSHKHGAIIVYKKKIISTGYNYFSSHLCHDYSIHAEVAAIMNIKSKKDILSECEMYVVRIARIDNVLKYSKPCDNCKKVINKFNIKKTYYSTNYEYDKLNI